MLDFVSVRGERAKGRDHAEHELTEIFKTRAKEATLNTKEVGVRFIRPDIALVHVTNELGGLVSLTDRKLHPTTRPVSGYSSRTTVDGKSRRSRIRWFVTLHRNLQAIGCVDSLDGQLPPRRGYQNFFRSSDPKGNPCAWALPCSFEQTVRQT